jgi:arylsulfatase
MAGNTPLRRWKREVHEGGVADPCVIKWPRAISARGEIRHQFTHAIDVLPTILESIGIVAPEKIREVEQSPIEGTSFSYLFNDANAPGQHTTQYFEMFGSRAIHHDGWKAVTFKPLAHMYDDGLDPEAPFADDVWELYHVAEDFSEVNNLAAAEPERLAAMVELWWREARQHQVLPLDNRPMAALLNPRRPFSDRRRAVFWPGGEVLPEQVGISVYRRNHTITVPLVVSETLNAPPEGVLLALGTVLGGWSLHLLDGRVRYVSNFLGSNVTVIESDEIVTPGAHTVGFSFSTQGEGGIATLWLDGKGVGEGLIERVTLFRHSISGAGYTCGWEQGPAVGPGYQAPFRCTAQIQKVIVEVDGPIVHDPKAEFEAIMAEQ